MPAAGWVVELRGYTYHEGKEEFVRNTLLENLIDLAEVNAKDRRLLKQGYVNGQMVDLSTLDPKQAKEIKKVVDWRGDMDKFLRVPGATKDAPDKPRISHIFIYHSQEDKNPQPGQFWFIYRSILAEKMNVWSKAWSGFIAKEVKLDEAG